MDVKVTSLGFPRTTSEVAQLQILSKDEFGSFPVHIYVVSFNWYWWNYFSVNLDISRALFLKNIMEDSCDSSLIISNKIWFFLTETPLGFQEKWAVKRLHTHSDDHTINDLSILTRDLIQSLNTSVIQILYFILELFRPCQRIPTCVSSNEHSLTHWINQ